uniref:Prolactin receptor n=1 Tax=Neogobius melanostomus TaxID=47308 RepID=A0A8C6UMP5_9GOBI
MWFMKKKGLWLIVLNVNNNSPPGKPVLKQCHSPDKEIFTCWWEPNAHDGEDTTYRLLYEKELTIGILECPDYHTAGKNSCFFDKNHTSIWVDYFLTVVAINAFGNTTSDVYKIDVVDIVKPNPPENVTLWLELCEDIPTIHVTWNSFNIGTKCGWITPKYQLRFKKVDSKWNYVGEQTQFSIYSASPGKLYIVQVQCALDNGAWSEWSNTTFIQVPRSESKQHIWILVSFSAILLFAAVCIMFIKKKRYTNKCCLFHSIQQWLLPPVPGPRIKGIDVQLLKNGRSHEATRALLINHGFPWNGMPWKNQAEEYLLVRDDNKLLNEDQKHTHGKMISNNCHSKPNINNQLNVHNSMNFKEEKTILDDLVDTSQSELVNELNYVNTMKTDTAFSIDTIYVRNVKPVENSRYVDIQRQDVDMEYSTVREPMLFPEKQNKVINRQQERLPYDYTRVKEVNGDMLLLQDPSFRNNTQNTDYINPTPLHPVTEKVHECAESLNDGYVDNPHTHNVK